MFVGLELNMSNTNNSKTVIDGTVKTKSNKLIIDVRSNECVYLQINGRTYNIDDSTQEHIMKSWITSEEEY
jgi:hypothetical protein